MLRNVAKCCEMLRIWFWVVAKCSACWLLNVVRLVWCGLLEFHMMFFSKRDVFYAFNWKSNSRSSPSLFINFPRSSRETAETETLLRRARKDFTPQKQGFVPENAFKPEFTRSRSLTLPNYLTMMMMMMITIVTRKLPLDNRAKLPLISFLLQLTLSQAWARQVVGQVPRPILSCPLRRTSGRYVNFGTTLNQTSNFDIDHFETFKVASNIKLWRCFGNFPALNMF